MAESAALVPMSPDAVKLLFTYSVTLAVLLGGFYALVIYPYDLDQLVKGAFLGFMSAALTFVYGDQIASRTAARQQRAFDAGLSATPNEVSK